MKQFLGFAVIASVISGSAFAADMAVPAPVYKAPPPLLTTNWTGCYGGINAGGFGATVKNTWSNITESSTAFAIGAATVLPAAANGSNSDGNFIVGGQLGCNYQTGAWVWGVAEDINYTGVNGSRQATSLGNTNGGPPTIVPGNIFETFSSHWLSTVRGRAGFTMGGPLLFYATGGLAVANMSYTDSACFPTAGAPACSTGSGSAIRVGYTVGGGIEYMIAPRWTINAEYLYVDMGTSSFTSTPSPAVLFPNGTILQSHQLKETIGRIGLNYRF